MCLFTEHYFGGFSRRAGHNSRIAYSPSPLGVLGTQKVPGPGTPVLDLAAGCNLDSLT